MCVFFSFFLFSSSFFLLPFMLCTYQKRKRVLLNLLCVLIKQMPIQFPLGITKVSASDIKCLSKCSKSSLFLLRCSQIIQSTFHINLLVWHSKNYSVTAEWYAFFNKIMFKPSYPEQSQANHYKYHVTFQWKTTYKFQ